MAITKWAPCSRSRRLVEVAHAHGVPVHVDAVQAVGRVEIDVQASGMDLLSCPAINSAVPKVLARSTFAGGLGASMQAVIHGGHQERERRAGTEDVPSIVALGKACALMHPRLAEEGTRLARLRDHLEAGVLSRIGGDPPARARSRSACPIPSNITFCGGQRRSARL